MDGLPGIGRCQSGNSWDLARGDLDCRMHAGYKSQPGPSQTQWEQLLLDGGYRPDVVIRYTPGNGENVLEVDVQLVACS